MSGVSGVSEERKPSRAVAIALAVLAGAGVGHFYIGAWRRALAWTATILVLAIATTVGLPSIGEAYGYRLAFAALLFPLVLGAAGPALDLLTIDRTRFRRIAPVNVLLFWMAVTAVAVSFRLALRGMFVEAFKIPSASMTPSLLVGDHFFIDRHVYKTRAPDRGEVVVFALPDKPTVDYVKRVIAVPGDQLEVHDGHPWLNGWEVPHCNVGRASFSAGAGDASEEHRGDVEVEYLDGHAYLTFYETIESRMGDRFGPVTARGEDSWVLGDNRNNSFDSRLFGGTGTGVSKDLVRGRVLFTWINVQDGRADYARVGLSSSTPELPRSMASLAPGLASCLAKRPSYEKTVPPPPPSTASAN